MAKVVCLTFLKEYKDFFNSVNGKDSVWIGIPINGKDVSGVEYQGEIWRHDSVLIVVDRAFRNYDLEVSGFTISRDEMLRVKLTQDIRLADVCDDLIIVPIEDAKKVLGADVLKDNDTGQIVESKWFTNKMHAVGTLMYFDTETGKVLPK